MLLKILSSGLNLAGVSQLREALEDLAARRDAAGHPQRLSMGAAFRNPVIEQERAFLHQAVRFFWTSPLPTFYRRTYDREPLLLLEFTTIRWQETAPDANYVPWHLDANFYGFGVPMITAWIPLVEVGREAPGLEFATTDRDIDDREMRRRWLAVPVEPDGRKAVDDAEIGGVMEAKITPRAVALSPGGFCVFDQYVLHRTQVLPGATKNRIAIEFRIADRDALPHDIDPPSLRGMLLSWLDRADGSLKIGYSGALFPELAQA